MLTDASANVTRGGIGGRGCFGGEDTVLRDIDYLKIRLLTVYVRECIDVRVHALLVQVAPPPQGHFLPALCSWWPF